VEKSLGKDAGKDVEDGAQWSTQTLRQGTVDLQFFIFIFFSGREGILG
jgi:hypothetical protein